MKMTMNPVLSRKLRLILEFCFLGAIAGIVYQRLSDGIIDYRAFAMGISLGFAFGIIELFILSGWRKHFLKLPLILSILVKALFYVVIIYVVSGLIGLMVGLSQGKTMEDFYDSLVALDQVILIAYTLLLYLFMSFYIQITFLLGEGIVFKFLLGKYRKPTAEHRIFMFLDLKSPTTIAERLGHVKYYSFLNDFFHEISEPARTTNAEIYQYIGDEVVFTWKTNEGLANYNCLNFFFNPGKST